MDGDLWTKPGIRLRDAFVSGTAPRALPRARFLRYAVVSAPDIVSEREIGKKTVKESATALTAAVGSKSKPCELATMGSAIRAISAKRDLATQWVVVITHLRDELRDLRLPGCRSGSGDRTRWSANSI
ncbi:MAG: hypothetical protein OTI36_13365 [Beijerinckiaceae bacterium]|nr:hypothetical protein [Beijerinckiaceae bacterium]